MAARFRMRDPNTGAVIMRETDFLTRYLFSVSIAWNDYNQKVFTHDGLTKGRPYAYIYNPNIHSMSVMPDSSGHQSYFDITFSGNQVTVKQNKANGVSDSYRIGKDNVIIHFGVY